MTRRLQRLGFLPILLLLFIAIQIPFLEADPHKDIAPTSRDAFTDEGLNTSQVINRVNHGTWVIDECDNLIKTPLFSAWLFPVYSLFGTSTLVGRLWVLLGCLFLLYIASRQHRLLAWVIGLFVLLSLTEFHLFQYIRFTMAELMACCLTLTGLATIMRYSNDRKSSPLFAAAVWFWAAVFVKNQFAYVLVLLPIGVACVHLLDTTRSGRKAFQHIALSILFLTLGAALYFIVWYLPTKETYDYVMADQAGGRFMSLQFLNEMRIQAQDFLFSPHTKFYSLFLIASSFLFIINWFNSKNLSYRLFSLLSLAWATVELHKFAMWYVPARYLSPLLFVWGIFACTQLAWSLKNAMDYGFFSKTVGIAALAIGLIALGMNIRFVHILFSERSFAIHETNKKLNAISFGNRPVIGPWAPSLARETGARVIPVWSGYFNDTHILETLNPKVIISEVDEGDSGQAFQKAGIRLDEIADSSSQVQIGRFDLVIYYLP